jgi:predicted DCC family thiol-disulfide oxidoreductase YuxK
LIKTTRTDAATTDRENRCPRSWPERLYAFWLGQLDLAPVGLFRVAFGVLLSVWICQLGPNLRHFFTDEGFLPRRSYFTTFQDRFSLLYLFGEWWQVVVFWAASLVVAVLLTIGYRTRRACGLAFLAIISFQQRNPLTWDGSDFVFRVIPFWLMFTAAGDRFSVDAALRRARGERVTGFGPALPIRILQLQLAWVYLASGLEKLGGRLWLDGTALYYALQLKHTWARAYAEPLAHVEPFVRAVSWGTLTLELGFLPAVFFPFLQPYLRTLAVAAAAMLHTGILVMMNVGNFPLIMLASLIPFFSPRFAVGVVGLGRCLFPQSGARMYYDGECRFCKRSVAFTRALDIYGTVEFVDLHRTDLGKTGGSTAKLKKRIHLVDDNGRIYTGFAAYARAARGIPFLLPAAIIGAAPFVTHLGERAYDWIASQRSRVFGCPGETHAGRAMQSAGALEPVIPESVQATTAWRTVFPTALVISIAFVVFATAMPKSVAWKLWSPLAGFARFASVDQLWDMFSPDPASTDGWMRAPGQLADGTLVDLIDQQGRPQPRSPTVIAEPPVENQPRSPGLFYTRWTKVHERIAYNSYGDNRLEYGRMYCRIRNRHLPPGESPLETFDLYYTERPISPPGQPPGPPRDHHLWSHRC